MNKNYINNLETGKIELHFTKEEYQALSEELKKELKGTFLFSGKSQAWVSRSKNNHYYAIRVAEKLGFINGGAIGEKLSFEEELNRKAEKAEARAERYEQYSYNAEKRAENLQKELNSYHEDMAFFTQPIITGHTGSQAFAKRKEKIFDRYRKGFEEYRKSEYYQEKAATSQATADMKQFKNPVYLNNRMAECNKSIKQLEKNVILYEDIIYKKQNNDDSIHDFYKNKSIEDIQNYLNDAVDKMEYNIDKLAYLKNCMDEINRARQQKGKKLYTKEDLKQGYQVKIRGTWKTVLKVNKTTVEVQPIEECIKMFIMKYPFAEIQDLKIPEGWIEPKEEENPFKENDIFVLYSFSMDKKIRAAYQVLKVTAKSVTVQELNLDGERKPILNSFKVDSKTLRKQVTQNKYTGNLRICIDDYELNKYVA